MLWELEPKGECFHSFFDLASVFLSSYRTRVFFGVFYKVSTIVSLQVVKISKFKERLYYHHILNNDGKNGTRNVAEMDKLR